MKQFKKILSFVSVLALMASVMTLPVKGAQVTGTITIDGANQATITLSGMASNFANDDHVTIVIKNASDGSAFNMGAGSSATIGGSAADGAVTTDVGNGVIEFDDNNGTTNKVVVLTTANAFSANTAYTFFVSNDTASESVLLLANYGTANQVTVSATVEPTLTFSITSGTNISFGIINTGNNVSSATTAIDLASNTTGSVTVTASAVGADTGTTAGALGASGTANTIPAIGSETTIASLDGTQNSNNYFAVGITDVDGGTAPDAGFHSAGVSVGIAGDSVNDLNGETTIMTAAGPVSSANGGGEVTYYASAADTTAPGDYSATVTYAATVSY